MPEKRQWAEEYYDGRMTMIKRSEITMHLRNSREVLMSRGVLWWEDSNDEEKQEHYSPVGAAERQEKDEEKRTTRAEQYI